MASGLAIRSPGLAALVGQHEIGDVLAARWPARRRRGRGSAAGCPGRPARAPRASAADPAAARCRRPRRGSGRSAPPTAETRDPRRPCRRTTAGCAADCRRRTGRHGPAWPAGRWVCRLVNRNTSGTRLRRRRRSWSARAAGAPGRGAASYSLANRRRVLSSAPLIAAFSCSPTRCISSCTSTVMNTVLPDSFAPTSAISRLGTLPKCTGAGCGRPGRSGSCSRPPHRGHAAEVVRPSAANAGGSAPLNPVRSREHLVGLRAQRAGPGWSGRSSGT